MKNRRGVILLLVFAGLVLAGVYFTNRNLTHTDISVVSDLRVTFVKEVDVGGDIQSISRSNVVATDKKILFFDSNLNLIKETMLPDNSRAYFSKDGNLIAQTTATNISEKGSDVTFKLMDKSEIVLWKTTNQLTNGPLLSSVNGGSGVERICYEGECTDKIFIFNKENLKGKVVNFASELERARSTGGAISQDGNYFAISFTGGENDAQLAFFDITGKQLWKYIIPQGRGSEIDVSPRGNFTVATIRKIPNINNMYLWKIIPHINNVYLFDKQGEVLFKHRVEYVGDFHYGFSNNERFLAVASSSSSGGELYLFDTGTLKLLWSHNLDQSDRGFTSLDVNDNGIVAAGVSTINREDISDGSLPRYLYVFDSKGVVAFQEKFANLEFPTWKYGLKILLDQNEDILKVGLKNKIREYRLQDIKENNSTQEAEQENTLTSSDSSEDAGDGIFQAYIKKIYTVNGKTFIDADYFQTLRGKQAAIRAINNGDCVLENMTKEQSLSVVNSLSDDHGKFRDEFYELPSWCFPNTIFLDVNDNTKIRTFEVDLKTPILMTYVREEYGAHEQQGIESVWSVSLDTYKNIISKAGYEIGFGLTISDNKVIGIQEIYRP